MTFGVIKIENFKVHCKIGIHPFEKQKEQELFITIAIKYDFSKCIKSDGIVDAIDYEKVGKICRELAEAKHYNLLETFAFVVLQAIFKTFIEIRKIGVVVKKQCGTPLNCVTAVELEEERR